MFIKTSKISFNTEIAVHTHQRGLMRQTGLGTAVFPSVPEQCETYYVLCLPALFSFVQPHLCYRTNFLQLKIEERLLLLDKETNKLN